jgi:hypothetical protein
MEALAGLLAVGASWITIQLFCVPGMMQSSFGSMSVVPFYEGHSGWLQNQSGGLAVFKITQVASPGGPRLRPPSVTAPPLLIWPAVRPYLNNFC